MLITSKSVCPGSQPVWVKTKINGNLAKETHKHASFSHFWGMCGAFRPGAPAHPVLIQQIADGKSKLLGAGHWSPRVLTAGGRPRACELNAAPVPPASLPPPGARRVAWRGRMAAPQLPPPGGCGTSKSPGS